MIDKIAQKFPGFSSLDENEKFVWMLSQDDKDSIKWVSNVIFNSMKKQRKAIELLLLMNKKKRIQTKRRIHVYIHVFVNKIVKKSR